MRISYNVNMNTITRIENAVAATDLFEAYDDDEYVNKVLAHAAHAVETVETALAQEFDDVQLRAIAAVLAVALINRI